MKKIIFLLIAFTIIVAASLGAFLYQSNHTPSIQTQKNLEDKKFVAKIQEQQTVKTLYVVVFNGKADKDVAVATKNEKMIWQNLDSAIYHLVFEDSPDATPQLTLEANKETEFTFSKPGTYKYKSVENPSLTGTVEVY